MKKIRALIEKRDGNRFLLKSNGIEFFVPEDFIKGEVGDFVNITFASDADDQKSSNEVAKELLKIALSGEK